MRGGLTLELGGPGSTLLLAILNDDRLARSLFHLRRELGGVLEGQLAANSHAPERRVSGRSDDADLLKGFAQRCRKRFGTLAVREGAGLNGVAVGYDSHLRRLTHSRTFDRGGTGAIR